MGLADDDRARVPFALVGVFLLVSSAALATTLSTREPGGATPDADLAVERAGSAIVSALRGAVDTAASNAGTNPVLSPANTSVGRVLNESTPFRDALRLRVYRQASTALADVDVRVGDARVTASLPPVEPNRAAFTLRRAKQRVHLSRTGNGSLAVRIDDVTVSVRHEGQVVARETRSVSFTAATPVLLVHDRVSSFETRLNRGPTEGRGFGRQFAARLYAWAWARGYVQYAGAAPNANQTVENVVSPEYVSLSANEAVLATQQGDFGRADDAGKRALGAARLQLLAGELVGRAPVSTPGISPSTWVDLVLGDPDGTMANAATEVPAPGTAGVTPEDPLTIGVNESASDAYAALLDGEGSWTIDEVLRETYSADVRVAATVRGQASMPDLPSAPDGPGWQRLGTRTDRDFRAVGGDATVPRGGRREHRLDSSTRVVLVTTTRTSRWVRWNDSRKTTSSATGRYRVGLAVLAEPAPAVPGPSRPIEDAFERAADGSLVEIRQRALARFDDRGSHDELARRAVLGTLDEQRTRLYATPPPGAESVVYDGLSTLRETTRNVSVETARGDLVTSATPAAELRDRVRDRRSALVDAPARYDGLVDRARVAVRAAYLDHLDQTLAARAEGTQRGRAGLGDALSAVGLSLDGLGETMAARQRVDRPETREFGHGGPAGPVELRVDAVPSYLVLNEISTEQASSIRTPGYHPLSTRNLNVFTVPYGQAADAVTSSANEDASPDSAALSVAVPSLFAMEAVSRELATVSARQQRDRLERAVGDCLDAISARVAADFAAETALTRDEADAAVAAGLAQWPTTSHRARAVVNGSAVDPIAAAAVARSDALDTQWERDAAGLRVESSLRDARRIEAARVDEDVLADSMPFLREQQQNVVAAAGTTLLAETDRTARQTRFDNESMRTMFAGVPVLPYYSWVATANVWVVEVRGTYARFTVRADRGTPAAPGGEFVYSRDGEAVRFDADGDGAAERVGYSDRVSFENSVGVLVVVPPGRTGVGDVDGTMDETSAGWGCPPPTVWPPRGTDASDASDASDATGCSKPLYRPV